jgi:putative nucleotidyltransferase with HDIG domain
MDRESAWALVQEYARSEKLVKHCIAVEAAMRAYARKVGGDEDVWGIAGMLHDFDWDVCPSIEQHPQFGADILRERGYPEVIVRAVLSHGNHTGVSRESLMEKALFAVDELSGFVTAVALVRPTRSLSDTDSRAVRRKMKDKAFARNVSRDDLVQGAQELGVDLDGLIEFVAESLKPVAGELGLTSGD